METTYSEITILVRGEILVFDCYLPWLKSHGTPCYYNWFEVYGTRSLPINIKRQGKGKGNDAEIEIADDSGFPPMSEQGSRTDSMVGYVNILVTNCDVDPKSLVSKIYAESIIPKHGVTLGMDSKRTQQDVVSNQEVTVSLLVDKDNSSVLTLERNTTTNTECRLILERKGNNKSANVIGRNMHSNGINGDTLSAVIDTKGAATIEDSMLNLKDKEVILILSECPDESEVEEEDSPNVRESDVQSVKKDCLEEKLKRKVFEKAMIKGKILKLQLHGIAETKTKYIFLGMNVNDNVAMLRLKGREFEHHLLEENGKAKKNESVPEVKEKGNTCETILSKNDVKSDLPKQINMNERERDVERKVTSKYLEGLTVCLEENVELHLLRSKLKPSVSCSEVCESHPCSITTVRYSEAKDTPTTDALYKRNVPEIYSKTETNLNKEDHFHSSEILNDRKMTVAKQEETFKRDHNCFSSEDAEDERKEVRLPILQNSCQNKQMLASEMKEHLEKEDVHVESVARHLSSELTNIRFHLPKKVFCRTESVENLHLFMRTDLDDVVTSKEKLRLKSYPGDGKKAEDISTLKATIQRCISGQDHLCRNEEMDVFLLKETMGAFDLMHQNVKNIKDAEKLHRDYKYEWIRYRSFQDYSKTFNMYPSSLAREGWWYSARPKGRSDEVTCFDCCKSYWNWIKGEDPRQHHADSCRFLRGTSANVPIHGRNPLHQAQETSTCMPEATNPTRSAVAQTSSAGLDDLFPHQESSTIETPVYTQNGDSYQIDDNENQNSERRLTDHANNHICNEGLQRQNEGNYTATDDVETSERVTGNTGTIYTGTNHAGTNQARSDENHMRGNMTAGKIKESKSKYAAYETMDTRMKSFIGWPSEKTQTPREMALAGLFYAGYEDYVRCHSCGIGLRNWDDGDDPWVEHARWSPNCNYVIRSRGKKFVDLIQRKAKESERSASLGNRQEHANSALEREMQSETIMSIRHMGYSDETIKSALTTLKRRLGPGKHRVTAHDVLDIMLGHSQDEAAVGDENTAAATTSTPVDGYAVSNNIGSARNPSKKSKETIASNSEKDMRTLQDDHKDLSEQLTCKICMERSVAMTFLPCGHIACCEQCSRKITRCPICRARIKSKHKTYLT